MSQTLAIFHDAYRELNAKRMFWIVLALSMLVVAVFAIPGINERGVTLFRLEFPGAWNTNVIPRAMFYKLLFTAFAIPIWLAWAASILALISTASIFPDMLSSKSVDLYLAKPISRLRLFLTKYVAGLLFVTLQVTAFTAASFVVIGIRGGEWEPGLLLAVPVIVIFYSYLFCVSVLVGVMTRSTMAAVLLTLLAWFGFWAVQQAEVTLAMFRNMTEVKIERLQRTIARNDADIARYEAMPPASQPAGVVTNLRFQRDGSIAQKDESATTLRRLRLAHRTVLAGMNVVPKTGQTIDLLRRWLAAAADLPMPHDESDPDDRHGPVNDPEVQRRLKREIESRSPVWIIGTSLGFEAVVLSLAAWIFCRRDY